MANPHELRDWFFDFGWLIPASIAFWFLLNQFGLAVVNLVRRQRTESGRLSRFLLIKVDAARFVIRWGLVLVLIVVEAYLILETFNYFYRLPEQRTLWIMQMIRNVKNIGIIIICVLTLNRLSRLISEAVLVRVSRQEGTNVRERELRIRTLMGVLQGVISTTLAVTGLLLILAQLDEGRSPTRLLAASAGVVGVIMAFGAQSLMRDFFAGFFILMENHYKIGDTVRIGDRTGKVEHISLRITTLRDDQGTLHLIPNGEVKIVSNMTFGWAQVVADITVNYAYEPDAVIAVLARVSKDMAEDSAWKTAITAPPEVVGVESLSTTTGATYRVAFRTTSASQLQVPREFRRRAYQALSESKIQVLPPPPATVG